MKAMTQLINTWHASILRSTINELQRERERERQRDRQRKGDFVGVSQNANAGNLFIIDPIRVSI